MARVQPGRAERGRGGERRVRGTERGHALQGTGAAYGARCGGARASASGPGRGPGRTTRATTPSCSRDGDRRNVVDRYRYWTVEAIRADLDRPPPPASTSPIENLAHDFNIGSVVRTANAFNAAAVHVVGRRRWNRRGAMVTDRYLTCVHHAGRRRARRLGRRRRTGRCR